MTSATSTLNFDAVIAGDTILNEQEDVADVTISNTGFGTGSFIADTGDHIVRVEGAPTETPIHNGESLFAAADVTPSGQETGEAARDVAVIDYLDTGTHRVNVEEADGLRFTDSTGDEVGIGDIGITNESLDDGSFEMTIGQADVVIEGVEDDRVIYNSESAISAIGEDFFAFV